MITVQKFVVDPKVCSVQSAKDEKLNKNLFIQQLDDKQSQENGERKLGTENENRSSKVHLTQEHFHQTNYKFIDAKEAYIERLNKYAQFKTQVKTNLISALAN